MTTYTFRQVEVFLEVCRSGSFSIAAERLGITQPAVSNQIRSLELALGLKLFERRQGGAFEPSQHGLKLQEYATQFLEQCGAIGRSPRHGRGRKGALRVFVGGHLLDDYIRPRLNEFLEEYPGMPLTFLPERSRARLVQDLAAGRIDVAVVTAAPDDPTPMTLSLGSVPVGVYLRRDIARRVGRREIASLPFLLPQRGTDADLGTWSSLARMGIEPTTIVATSQYHDVLVGMACRGRGAVFSLQSLVDRHDRSGVLRCILHGEPYEQRMYINPRIEPAARMALAGFFTGVLGGATATQHQPIKKK